MYAVIETGGKQYTVREGQSLKIEKLVANTGDAIEFDKVMLVSKDGAVTLGQPTIAGAVVKATVTAQGRARKVTIMKFRRRKDSRLKKGHRQHFTQVTIDGISA